MEGAKSMNREEAIRRLKNTAWLGSNDDRSATEEAVEMAIEALKNEINCVKCEYCTEEETQTGIKGVCKMDTAHRGDTIYRSDAIDSLSEAYEGNVLNLWEDIETTLESLPSVEQVTRKLKNRDDSLLTEDSTDSKEQKSKLDLISRQDVIDAFSDVLDSDFPYISEETPRERIDSIPSADPKTGTWVLAHVGTIAEGYYCSRCGKHGYQTDFCHNCGADMRGGVDERTMED